MSVLDTFSRIRRVDDRHHRGDPIDAAGAVAVHVSQTLAPIVAEVAARLGPGFDLTVGPPVEGDIAVLAAMGREAIAFLHAQHPATVLLVVKRGATGHEDEAVDYLHAGADQFLEPGSLDEIALSIRVLARRLQPSPSRRNSTQR